MVVLTISLLELVSIGTVATCDTSPTVSEVLPVTTDVFEETTFELDLSLDVSELVCVEIEGVNVFVTIVSVPALIIVPASTTELPPVVSVPVLIMVPASTTELPLVVSVPVLIIVPASTTELSPVVSVLVLLIVSASTTELPLVVSVSVLIIVLASTTELPPVVSIPVLIIVPASTTELLPVVSVLTSDEMEFIDDSDWIVISLAVVSLSVCTLPVETEVIEDSDDCVCEFD
jgi:hypothetical protein